LIVSIRLFDAADKQPPQPLVQERRQGLQRRHRRIVG